MKCEWFKPEYCIDRKLSCDQCENFVKEDKTCLLTEQHVKILDDVKRKSGGRSQS